MLPRIHLFVKWDEQIEWNEKNPPVGHENGTRQLCLRIFFEMWTESKLRNANERKKCETNDNDEIWLLTRYLLCITWASIENYSFSIDIVLSVRNSLKFPCFFFSISFSLMFFCFSLFKFYIFRSDNFFLSEDSGELWKFFMRKSVSVWTLLALSLLTNNWFFFSVVIMWVWCHLL